MQNGDGNITAEELAEVLKALGMSPNRAQVRPLEHTHTHTQARDQGGTSEIVKGYWIDEPRFACLGV